MQVRMLHLFFLHGDGVRRRKTHQQGRIASFSFSAAVLLILHVIENESSFFLDFFILFALDKNDRDAPN